MGETAITVEGLGKRYRLGQLQPRPTRITEAAGDGIRRLARRSITRDRAEEPHIWALHGLGFEVPEGESIGIIGRNGAGKTTLLRILARITNPTEGRVEIRGRVRAVIDLGAGVHQELTGRENIYLNGAILGMKKAEIKAKFDQIVDFAGIEAFLDTPVKRYSAGMKVRLSFSVAAHLEPDVLLIDEVLAVGDAEFQRKCLGRMTDIHRSGRTVVFVSHNMNAVENLCDRVLWLESGAVRTDGDAPAVVTEYLKNRTRLASAIWHAPADLAENPDVRVHSIRLVDADGTPTTTFERSKPALVEYDLEVLRDDPRLRIGIDLVTQEGLIVFRSWHDDAGGAGSAPLEPGRWRVRCAIPPDLLNQGLYSVGARIKINMFRWSFTHEDVLQLEIEDELIQLGRDQSRPGVSHPTLAWEAEPVVKAPASTLRSGRV
jgi:lipopolysaccharide transport system ATP-binding protein